MTQLSHHPVWLVATPVCTILALGYVLWLNASNFDETEIKAIVEFALIVSAGRAIKNQIEKKSEEK